MKYSKDIQEVLDLIESCVTKICKVEVEEMGYKDLYQRDWYLGAYYSLHMIEHMIVDRTSTFYPPRTKEESEDRDNWVIRQRELRFKKQS